MKAPELLPLKRFVDSRRPITYGIVQAGENDPMGVPYIRPIDMTDHDGVPDPAQLLRTSSETARAYKRSEVRSGDIVLSIGPSYGKTMLVNKNLAGANLTQGTARIAVDRGHFAPYVRWALRSSIASASWDATVGGATFRALNLEPLSETPIPHWPIASQHAIADYLDRVTARIDALLSAKRRMVQLLEERLAIYTRQLLMSGNHPLRPLKRTWRVIDCKHRTPTYIEHGYPVISPGDATPGRLGLLRARRFVGEGDYRDLTEGGRQPRKGDVIYSRNASIGIAAFVDTALPFCMGRMFA